MARGRKTGGRIKGVSFNKATGDRRGPLYELVTLAAAADSIERRAAETRQATRAARRRVADDYRAAAQVLKPAMEALNAAAAALAPTLTALQAAISALETLMGPPVAAKPTTAPKVHKANGTPPPLPTPAAPSASPPSIREIRTIMTEQGIGRVEAKRIQEAEIIARAEWRPSITTH